MVVFCLQELAEELQERFGDLLASGDGGSRQGEEPGSAGKKPVVGWDSEGAHYLNREQPETMLRYLLVLDAINFCFWPSEGGDFLSCVSFFLLFFF